MVIRKGERRERNGKEEEREENFKVSIFRNYSIGKEK